MCHNAEAFFDVLQFCIGFTLRTISWAWETSSEWFQRHVLNNKGLTTHNTSNTWVLNFLVSCHHIHLFPKNAVYIICLMMSSWKIKTGGRTCPTSDVQERGSEQQQKRRISSDANTCWKHALVRNSSSTGAKNKTINVFNWLCKTVKHMLIHGLRVFIFLNSLQYAWSQ